MTSQTNSRMKRGGVSTAFSALLLVAAACASGGGGGSGSSMDLITREQIEESNYSTALQVVQRLKPRWLRPVRGGGTFRGPPPEPVVLLDGVRFGDLSSLSGINAIMVDHMEFMTATEATTLYGTGYMGGAIRVFTRGR